MSFQHPGRRRDMATRESSVAGLRAPGIVTDSATAASPQDFAIGQGLRQSLATGLGHLGASQVDALESLQGE